MAISNDEFYRKQKWKIDQLAAEKQEKMNAQIKAQVIQGISRTAQATGRTVYYQGGSSLTSNNTGGYSPIERVVGPFTAEEVDVIMQSGILSPTRVDKRAVTSRAKDEYYLVLDVYSLQRRFDKPLAEAQSDWQDGYDKGFEDGEKIKK